MLFGCLKRGALLIGLDIGVDELDEAVEVLDGDLRQDRR